MFVLNISKDVCSDAYIHRHLIQTCTSPHRVTSRKTSETYQQQAMPHSSLVGATCAIAIDRRFSIMNACVMPLCSYFKCTSVFVLSTVAELVYSDTLGMNTDATMPQIVDLQRHERCKFCRCHSDPTPLESPLYLRPPALHENARIRRLLCPLKQIAILLGPAHYR